MRHIIRNWLKGKFLSRRPSIGYCWTVPAVWSRARWVHCISDYPFSRPMWWGLLCKKVFQTMSLERGCKAPCIMMTWSWWQKRWKEIRRVGKGVIQRTGRDVKGICWVLNLWTFLVTSLWKFIHERWKTRSHLWFKANVDCFLRVNT